MQSLWLSKTRCHFEVFINGIWCVNDKWKSERNKGRARKKRENKKVSMRENGEKASEERGDKESERERNRRRARNRGRMKEIEVERRSDGAK